MKTLTILFALIISQFSFADSWDNLTYAEAQGVVAELEENPFVFDYCDCCDFSGEYATRVYLLKVTKAEIVECSWDSKFYSVKMESTVIAEMKYARKGLNTKKLLKPIDTNAAELVSMNYTWGFISQNSDSKAHPFFDLVDYSTYGEGKPCKKPFSYPSPKAVMKVSNDLQYGTWYEKNIGK